MIALSVFNIPPPPTRTKTIQAYEDDQDFASNTARNTQYEGADI